MIYRIFFAHWSLTLTIFFSPFSAFIKAENGIADRSDLALEVMAALFSVSKRSFGAAWFDAVAIL